MPLNVLFLHGVTAIGGAERDLLAIAGQLSGFGVDPIVGCPGEGQLVQELIGQGTKVVSLPFPPWRKPRSFASRLPAIYRLYRTVVRARIDLIHVNDMWWAPLGYCAARLAGIPCVVHIRQELEPRRVRQYWLRRPSRVIAVSSAIKETLEQGGVDPARLSVLYSGLDLAAVEATVAASAETTADIRRYYQIDPCSPVVGTVANLFPRKGHEYLIRAVGVARQVIPTIRCLIVGNGDPYYLTDLRALAKDLGLAEHVIFAGFKQPIYPLLTAMDVFALPSVMEGFGIALLEAMAMGKPVVASSVGGIPEIVEHGATGLLVPPRDVTALADSLIRLLQDEQAREEMGQAGVSKVRSQFSLERVGHTLQELYQSLVISPPRTTGLSR